LESPHARLDAVRPVLNAVSAVPMLTRRVRLVREEGRDVSS